MCSEPVMRSWCMPCLFLPGFDSSWSSIRSGCGPHRHIRLSVKRREVCRRHLLRCSPRPAHDDWPPRQESVKKKAKVIRYSPVAAVQKIKNSCMVMQLRVLPFNSHSRLLWQMSDLEFKRSAVTKRFNMRSCAGANSKGNGAIFHRLSPIVHVVMQCESLQRGYTFYRKHKVKAAQPEKKWCRW